MFKRIAAATLMLGAALTLAPTVVSAQDYDRDYRSDQRAREKYRERERREFRKHEARERARAYRNGYSGYSGYATPYYNGGGYYDRFGCYHRW